MTIQLALFSIGVVRRVMIYAPSRVILLTQTTHFKLVYLSTCLVPYLYCTCCQFGYLLVYILMLLLHIVQVGLSFNCYMSMFIFIHRCSSIDLTALWTFTETSQTMKMDSVM